ncbi:hypothetical protein B7802_07530 [Salmonella enterica]|nr:hypothetical protein [Salmonella enterica]ECW0264969.1 hypothetical protein [Salmonella enterica subsp. diarizonae]EBD5983692.1 hypothetical protein [Salmonella enterica]EBI4324816.1 hypothetical protein [Salmonella enterica]ECO4385982.1 hypothetical protein [Salmonella enterica]
MKLSPEAKQAIKTAIEQLRLLLVNDAMDTVREEVGRHLEDDGKGKDEKIIISGDCRIEGKLSAGKIEGDAECPGDTERLKKTFLHLAKTVIDDEIARLQSEKRLNEEALDSINLKRLKETFLQVASEVIAKERS